MGFNKRFVSECYIQGRLSMGDSLDRIFNADCLIFTDDFSYNLYTEYQNTKLKSIK